jgi:WD40 repeat protein
MLDPSAHIVLDSDGNSCAAEGWQFGPVHEAGVVVEFSDRNIFCMSVCDDEVVVGCADHALYSFNVREALGGSGGGGGGGGGGGARTKPKPPLRVRKYYGKTCGHTEWVTCVTHLDDGQVLSGGMDNKMCLWAKGGSSCVDISTHSASISVLRSGGQFVLSGSYDKSLRLWKKETSTTRRGGGGGGGLSERGVLKGHKAPVLCAAWGTVGTVIRFV